MPVPISAPASGQAALPLQHDGSIRIRVFTAQTAQMEQEGKNDLAREPGLDSVAGKKEGVFPPSDAAGSIALGLLKRMAAKRAKRFAGIGQVSLLQQMKPHFHIDDLPVPRIKPAPGIRFAKQDRRRFAHQVFSILH